MLFLGWQVFVVVLKRSICVVLHLGSLGYQIFRVGRYFDCFLLLTGCWLLWLWGVGFVLCICLGCGLGSVRLWGGFCILLLILLVGRRGIGRLCVGRRG